MWHISEHIFNFKFGNKIFGFAFSQLFHSFQLVYFISVFGLCYYHNLGNVLLTRHENASPFVTKINPFLVFFLFRNAIKYFNSFNKMITTWNALCSPFKWLEKNNLRKDITRMESKKIEIIRNTIVVEYSERMKWSSFQEFPLEFCAENVQIMKLNFTVILSRIH